MPPKTVVIHQPDFLPYLGFFQRFVHADLYIALDHVQFVQHTQNAWTHRDKIKTPKGAAWLSLAVKKCPLDTAIKDVELADTPWRKDHLNLLFENYKDAPYFDMMYGGLERIYGESHARMADLNLALMDLICGFVAIDIPRVRSSDIAHDGSKSELVAGLVEAVNGTRYLSGTGAKAYHEQEPFDRRGIEVAWQAFQHPTYPQLHGPSLPGLSIIDTLFNCGPEWTRDMLHES
ncbi:WbqC family protein [soil metagenome]